MFWTCQQLERRVKSHELLLYFPSDFRVWKKPLTLIWTRIPSFFFFEGQPSGWRFWAFFYTTTLSHALTVSSRWQNNIEHSTNQSPTSMTTKSPQNIRCSSRKNKQNSIFQKSSFKPRRWRHRSQVELNWEETGERLTGSMYLFFNGKNQRRLLSSN